MKTLPAFALTALLAATSLPQAWALGGDLDRPGIALPERFDPDLRQRIMAVLTAEPDTYAGGGFVNAHSTLRYAGDTAALNRFLAGLAGCAGLRLQVAFTADPNAPAWTVTHDAWKEPCRFEVRVNTAAGKISAAELVLPEIVAGARATADSTGIPRRAEASMTRLGPTMEHVMPFGVPCARKLFRFRTGEVFPIGDGPGDSSDHAEEWAKIDATGGVDSECHGGKKGFQLVGRGCVFTNDAIPDWEDATADSVMGKLRRAAWITGVIEAEAGKLPLTWLFKTFNGDCGILQILGIAEDAQGLEVRYRLVDAGAEPAGSSGTGS